MTTVVLDGFVNKIGLLFSFPTVYVRLYFNPSMCLHYPINTSMYRVDNVDDDESDDDFFSLNF